MRLTEKLLSLIHRAIKKDPVKFIALRLRYSTGAMTWKVQDAVLTTTVVDGPGQSLTVDLTQYTITQLVNFLASKPGYTVVYMDGTERAQMSARVLLDGSGDIATSNGDAIHGYTNALFSYLEAMSVELNAAEAQITEMVKQMSTKTASGEWLDELGGYYGVPRLQSEADASYGPRIIAEVLRPRGNNVAIEAAIKSYTGQVTKVTDVVTFASPTPAYNGAITHNSAATYSATSKPAYGLFDVEYGYDLINGGSITEFAATITSLISRLRDAGTQLRALTLTGSALSDSYSSPPVDDGNTQSLSVVAGLSDSLTAPDDSTFSTSAIISTMTDTLTAPADTGISMSVTYSINYNGVRTYNGFVPYAGGGGAVVELI